MREIEKSSFWVSPLFSDGFNLDSSTTLKVKKLAAAAWDLKSITLLQHLLGFHL
jgi:hypothetical protein